MQTGAEAGAMHPKPGGSGAPEAGRGRRDLPRVSEATELWLWPQLWDQARLQPPCPRMALCVASEDTGTRKPLLTFRVPGFMVTEGGL